MHPAQAILTGWLAGAVGREARAFIGITGLHYLTDEKGNYLPAFEVSLSTGETLRVRVELAGGANTPEEIS